LLNRSIATNSLTVGDAKAALATWHTIGKVLGISAGRPTNVAIAEGVRCIPDTQPPIPVLNGSNDRIAEEIFQLVFERHRAKKAKDFARADAVRAELKAKGWLVEDTPKGPKLKRAG
jgi:cysteinyl-tRNA synthetase